LTAKDKSEFEGFTNFSQSFNFSAVDAYFDSIQNLYAYNLTNVANNMTVQNYAPGWNNTAVYLPKKKKRRRKAMWRNT
jgi:hypothetical protein